MTRKSAYQRWLSRVEDVTSPWTEQEIIYFRKAVSSSGLRDPAERALLRSLFRQRAQAEGYRITREHDRKGREYILENSLRKNGQLRKGSKFGTRELKIIEALQYHLLVDLHGQEHYLAVYRAVSMIGTVTYIGATYSMIEVFG